MMPLIDENPVRRVPFVTITLIVICTVVFFLVQPTGKNLFDNLGLDRVQRNDLEFSLRWAAIPCEVKEGRPLSIGEARATFVDGNLTACGAEFRQGPAVKPDKNIYLAVLVSIFLHGSVAHLVGNMLFLWVFGNNIEDRRGAFGFACFYLSAGLVATAAQFLLSPNSTVPLIGASGAIAGVMGAYVVWFPNARIRSLIIIGPVFFRKVKAKWLLGIWFAQQFFFVSGDGAVAWMAHVGGFAFGVIIGLIWRRADHEDLPPLPEPLLQMGH
jgi:membrane associated rhomboid family serine protease